MKRLLKAQIEQAKADGKDDWLWDGEIRGFGVRVRPSGRKVFIYSYRPKGGGRAASKRKVTIGTFGSVTLEQARQEARRLAGLVAAGRCPATERDAKRAELHAASDLAELASIFLADRRAKMRSTTVAEYERSFNRDVLPALGRRKIASITRTEIASLHRGMSERPYQANRVLTMLHAAFRFAELHELRPAGSNPCSAIEKYPEHARESYLTEAQFAMLGVVLIRAAREGLPVPDKLKSRKRGISKTRAAKSTGRKRGSYRKSGIESTPSPANPYAVAAIRFLLLSGWREREALTLRWDYLDAQRGTATLPATKTGRSVRHLGVAAWQLLSELPRREGPLEKDKPAYVFPGSREGEPLKEIARVWEAVRHAASLETIRLHDLRHSHASVGAGDLGLSLPTLGALLGHTEIATTQRYAHLADDPRKRAADALSGRIAQLLAGEDAPTSDGGSSNVLHFAKRA